MAPGLVGAVAPGTVTTTTIALSYTAANGTAPMSYAGAVSLHGADTWAQNGGTFTSSGGTFSGLVPNTNYDLRIIARNAFGSSTTAYLLGVQTSAASATTFQLALSATVGPPGASVQLSVTPIGAPWPSGEVITPSFAGLAGAFDNASLVGSGSTPLLFNFTPSSGPGINGSLTASAPGLVNATGTLSYSVSAVSPNKVANRFDAVFPVSAAAAGATQTLSLIPNGSWPTATGTITAAISKGSGSFPDGATVAFTAGSSVAGTIRYTPGSGSEHAITFSNTLGLYNPYPAPLTVFSTISGSVITFSAATIYADQMCHQRDTVSGSPAGFSIAETHGWGEVPITISASVPCLYVRLYDCFSTNASGNVGTGTALHPSPVQVYGAASAGTITLLLPAVRGTMFYADVATDAAFTKPVRIGNRFSIGIVFGFQGRSFESGSGTSYAQNGGAVSNPWTKAVSGGTLAYQYEAVTGWFRHDGVSGDSESRHYGATSSAGTMELGRIVDAQFGVMAGVVGVFGVNGGGVDQFVGHGGSLNDAFRNTVGPMVGGKFRYYLAAMNAWDTVDPNYPENITEYRTRFKSAVDWIPRNYPACAIIGWTSSSGWFGYDGSRPFGYTRTAMIFLDEIEPINPMVVSKESYNWNEFVQGHASMAARMQYIRSGARLVFSAEPAAMGGNQGVGRGPTIASTASVAAGSRVVRFPYTLHGGTALQAVNVVQSTPNFSYTAATSAQVAQLFAIYAQGGYAGNGQPISITSAAINASTGTIDVTLAGSAGLVFVDGTTGAMPSALTAHYASDFGASSGGLVNGNAIVLCDDRTDLGIGMGWHMRPKLDIAVSVG